MLFSKSVQSFWLSAVLYMTWAAALSSRCNLSSVARGDPTSSALQLSRRETPKQFISDFAVDDNLVKFCIPYTTH